MDFCASVRFCTRVTSRHTFMCMCAYKIKCMEALVLCAYTRLRMPAYIFSQAKSLHIHTHTHTHTNERRYTCIQAEKFHTHVHAGAHTCTHARTHTRTHADAHMHSHPHTHLTYTQTQCRSVHTWNHTEVLLESAHTYIAGQAKRRRKLRKWTQM